VDALRFGDGLGVRVGLLGRARLGIDHGLGHGLGGGCGHGLGGGFGDRLALRGDHGRSGRLSGVRRGLVRGRGRCGGDDGGGVHEGVGPLLGGGRAGSETDREVSADRATERHQSAADPPGSTGRIPSITGLSAQSHGGTIPCGCRRRNDVDGETAPGPATPGTPSRWVRAHIGFVTIGSTWNRTG
jgi:hypothetical protein